MHFPFRRAAHPAWALRLPQLQRGRQEPVAPVSAMPEPGGVALALTARPAQPASVAIRDVVADPVAAERFPPSALVAAIVASDAENRALRRRLHARRRELKELRTAMAEHVADDAEIRGRMRTLEDVIAALHANLEDLRLQRDQLLAGR